jgi:hypothetical protein
MCDPHPPRPPANGTLALTRAGRLLLFVMSFPEPEWDDILLGNDLVITKPKAVRNAQATIRPASSRERNGNYPAKLPAAVRRRVVQWNRPTPTLPTLPAPLEPPRAVWKADRRVKRTPAEENKLFDHPTVVSRSPSPVQTAPRALAADAELEASLERLVSDLEAFRPEPVARSSDVATEVTSVSFGRPVMPLGSRAAGHRAYGGRTRLVEARVVSDPPSGGVARAPSNRTRLVEARVVSDPPSGGVARAPSNRTRLVEARVVSDPPLPEPPRTGQGRYPRRQPLAHQPGLSLPPAVPSKVSRVRFSASTKMGGQQSAKDEPAFLSRQEVLFSRAIELSPSRSSVSDASSIAERARAVMDDFDKKMGALGKLLDSPAPVTSNRTGEADVRESSESTGYAKRFRRQRHIEPSPVESPISSDSSPAVSARQGLPRDAFRAPRPPPRRSSMDLATSGDQSSDGGARSAVISAPGTAASRYSRSSSRRRSNQLAPRSTRVRRKVALHLGQ